MSSSGTRTSAPAATPSKPAGSRPAQKPVEKKSSSDAQKTPSGDARQKKPVQKAGSSDMQKKPSGGSSGGGAGASTNKATGSSNTSTSKASGSGSTSKVTGATSTTAAKTAATSNTQRKVVEKKGSADRSIDRKPSGDSAQRQMDRKGSGDGKTSSRPTSSVNSSRPTSAVQSNNTSTNAMKTSARGAVPGKSLSKTSEVSSSNMDEVTETQPVPRRAHARHESSDSTFGKDKKPGPPSIHSDAAEGDVAKVQEWLDKETDINKRNANGASALILASSHGHFPVVQLLVDNGADVNLKNFYNDTALMYASGKGYAEIVEYLLKNKANVHERDNEGRTALMVATYADCAELLLDYGARVLELDNNGETALFHIAERTQDYHLETAKVLLARGALVNDIGDHNQTPLMRATFCGNKRMCQLFIQRGADTLLRDDRDRTARDLALERGFTNIAAMLEKAEADQLARAPAVEADGDGDTEGLFDSVSRWLSVKKTNKSGKSIGGRSNSMFGRQPSGGS